jgi:DNA repair ATPase RecN
VADSREHTEALDQLRDENEALTGKLAHALVHWNTALKAADSMMAERDAAQAEVDRLHRQITQLADDLHDEADALDSPERKTFLRDNLTRAQTLRDAARRVHALGQPAPQPVPDNQQENK